MLKQVFLARLEPVVMRFGPWKIRKCLETGLFWDQKCVKYICIYYYTPLRLNLANNNNNKHVSVPFWPLLCPNASDLLPMWPSGSLGGCLAKSKY